MGGCLSVVTRIAQKTVSPITLLLFHSIIASLALCALVRIGWQNMRIKRGDRKYFIFIGAVCYFVSVGAQVVGT
ncbi:MAG: EamA family transporter [Bacteroidota bacterium]|nr:EamA family transporter [Bacteroidota bacterium]